MATKKTTAKQAPKTAKAKATKPATKTTPAKKARPAAQPARSGASSRRRFRSWPTPANP